MRYSFPSDPWVCEGSASVLTLIFSLRIQNIFDMVGSPNINHTIYIPDHPCMSVEVREEKERMYNADGFVSSIQQSSESR